MMMRDKDKTRTSNLYLDQQVQDEISAVRQNDHGASFRIGIKLYLLTILDTLSVPIILFGFQLVNIIIA